MRRKSMESFEDSSTFDDLLPAKQSRKSKLTLNSLLPLLPRHIMMMMDPIIAPLMMIAAACPMELSRCISTKAMAAQLASTMLSIQIVHQQILIQSKYIVLLRMSISCSL